MNKQGCFDAMWGYFPIQQDEKGDFTKRNQQKQKVRARRVRCTGETGHGTGGAGSNICRTQTHELREKREKQARCKAIWSGGDHGQLESA